MNSPDSVEQVSAFATAVGMEDLSVKFWDHYQKIDWKTVKGTPVKDWKLLYKNFVHKEIRDREGTHRQLINKGDLSERIGCSINEIRLFAAKAGLPDQAAAFWLYYEGKGWRIGSRPMGNWRVVYRNWVRRSKDSKEVTGTSYADKLKDPRWKELRSRVIERDGSKCTNCEYREDLQVHHGYYKWGKEPWEYDIETLHTLCERCHLSRHRVEGYLKIIIARLSYKELKGVFLAICES